VGRFEIANGGTLFLDEIANMSPNMQARLLRVIETGQFEPVGSSRTQRTDVRVVSATNADLEKEVAEGRFRRDLLYRLNTVEIRVPSLRARRRDIPLLAMHFLRQSGRRYRKQVSRFDDGAMQMLLDYQWPGNVRELDHVVERAVLMSDTEEIRPSDLGLRSASQGDGQLEEMSLEEVERCLIKKALSRFGGNVSQTADFLGLSRSALYRRLEKHGL
jgi:DNA-binding NtrC family response regulator